MTIVRTLAILCVLSGTACGPIPGGPLGGKITPTPSDWSATVPDKRFCEIESRPANPHSIQLECFRFEDGLYVNSHRWALASWWPVTSWAAIWIAAPAVRVRMGEAIYELRALRIEIPEPRAAILRHRGYEPPPDGIVVFRFVPRG